MWQFLGRPGVARPQPGSSGGSPAGSHELLKGREFVGGNVFGLDVAVGICAVGKTVALDEPPRAHFAVPVPGYTVVEAFVGEMGCPSLAGLESTRLGLRCVVDLVALRLLFLARRFIVIPLVPRSFCGVLPSAPGFGFCVSGIYECGRELDKKGAKPDVLD